MTRVVELQITDVAFGGKGVGRFEGKAVFIPYVIDGETVEARIVQERKNVYEAELVQALTPSPHRVSPPCPYFGRCGGCVYQHIDYPHQLEIKARQVEQTLRRIGKLTNFPMRPMIASPLVYEYRNRVTVHVRDGVIGFFERDSQQLLDVEFCPISQAAVNARLAQLRAARPRAGHYTLRAADGPRIFTQANHAAATALLGLVDELLRTSHARLIDAYCGAGFFAKHLRSRFASVLGIDWDRHAIAHAARDVAAHEHYIAGDIADELRQHVPSVEPGAALIVDPPAEGLNAAVRDAIVSLAPARFIYVSCNPATLARDLAHLTTAFQIESVTPIDMFPQTAEIETVVALNARTPSARGHSQGSRKISPASPAPR